MDKFLETYTLPRLNKEKLENLNRLTTSNETESVIKKFPKTKVQDQMALQVNSTKLLKELIPIVCKLQLTLEQRRFELHGSTYMKIFFNSKYYSTTWPVFG